MFNQNYNVYWKNKEEIKYWASKKLEDVKKDICDMIEYYGFENIESIKIELNIFEKSLNEWKK